jgi:hypothetical protein
VNSVSYIRKLEVVFRGCVICQVLSTYMRHGGGCSRQIGGCLLGVYAVSYIRLVGGYIYTVKGDTLYFGNDIYKLLTCRSDGIA